MKLKELEGIKRNSLVILLEDGSIHKIVRIDGHVYPYCLDDLGRVKRDQIEPYPEDK